VAAVGGHRAPRAGRARGEGEDDAGELSVIAQLARQRLQPEEQAGTADAVGGGPGRGGAGNAASRWRGGGHSRHEPGGQVSPPGLRVVRRGQSRTGGDGRTAAAGGTNGWRVAWPRGPHGANQRLGRASPGPRSAANKRLDR